ncbi:hypothetical protein [Xylocopilactobacillus apicola]|uniref:Replication protein RepB n=1 Tax=Xylocopilactobacillus apicola TaxID=2932184 RepID=A0AAU9DAP5_9LACO|nr:hypothetical protein [Xylocopilactobacillus apicola]BDR59465.1 hypothetical protein XA3_19060 [Xylocopilactobacillus apicola]
MTTTITALAKELGVNRSQIQQIVQKRLKEKPNKDQSGRYVLSPENIAEIKQCLQEPVGKKDNKSAAELKAKDQQIFELNQQMDKLQSITFAQADELKELQDRLIKMEQQIKNLKNRTLWQRIRNTEINE